MYDVRVWDGSTGSKQDQVADLCEHGDEHSGSIKGEIS
jgi:hypothetical protein